MKTRRAFTSLRLAGLLVVVAMVAGAALLVLGTRDGASERAGPLRLRTPQEAAEPAVLPPPVAQAEETPEPVARPVVAVPVDVPEAPREDPASAARTAHEINVLVVAGGAPVAGAKVEIWWKDPIAARVARPAASLTTDRDGFVLARIKGNAFRILAQSADGKAMGSDEVKRTQDQPLAGGRRGFLIELERAALVRGVVLDIRGHPASGAEVELQRTHVTGDWSNPRDVSVESDPQGRFEVGVAGGPYRVTAQSGGARSFDQLLRAEPGGVHELTLQLPGEWWVQGIVLDDGGRPSPKARVTLWQDLPRDGDGNVIPVPWNRTRLDVQADETGRYRVDMPRLAAGTLIAFTEPPHPAPGWRSHSSEVSAEDATWHRDVALRLLPPSAIAGHVQDPDGKPLKGKVSIRLAGGADARDAARKLAANDRIGKASVDSEDDGVFEIAPLLASAAYDLAFETALGEVAFEGEVRGVPAGAQGVTIVARPDADRAGSLRGTVLVPGDSLGGWCANVTAAWHGDDGKWVFASTETRNTRFVLGGLPANLRGLLRISSQSGAGIWLEDVDLSGRSGDVAVTLPAPGGLELQVLGEGDAAAQVPAVSLTFDRNDDWPEKLVPRAVVRPTDDAGRAAFEGLEPGRWHLRCQGRAGTASVDIVIEPGVVRQEVIHLSQ